MTPATLALFQRTARRLEGRKLTLRELAQVWDSDVWPPSSTSVVEPEPEPEVELPKAKPERETRARRAGPRSGTIIERLLRAYEAEPPAATAVEFWKSLGEALHIVPLAVKQRAGNAGLSAKVLP